MCPTEAEDVEEATFVAKDVVEAKEEVTLMGKKGNLKKGSPLVSKEETRVMSNVTIAKIVGM